MDNDTFVALFPVFCLVVACVLLITFGVVFDRFVTHAEATGRDEGHTWMYVAIGVSATLVAVGLVDLIAPPTWNAGLLALVCFAASGTPMIVGAVRRHERLRTRLLKTIEEVHDGRSSGPAGQ